MVRGAGGHHHVAPGVGEVLAQAAVVPAVGRGLVRAGRGVPGRHAAYVQSHFGTKVTHTKRII